MRTRTAWAAAILVGFALVAAAWATDGGRAADVNKEAIQGTWRCTSSEMNGEKQPEDDVKQYTLVFSGDKLTVNKGGDLVMKGTVKLDPAEKPAHLDLTLEENPGNPSDVGKTLPGLVELKGDEMKWCFTLPDRSERPKEFKTEADSSQILATFKREAK